MNISQAGMQSLNEIIKQAKTVDPATQVAAELIKLKESLGVSLIIRDRNLNTISAQINSMAHFLRNPELISRLSGDYYVSDAAGTTWLKFQIKKGRIVSIEFLLMFKTNWVKIINRTFSGSGFEFILAGYSPGDETVGATVAVVPEADFSPDRIWKHFKLTIGQTATDMKEVGKLVCYILSKYLINPAPKTLDYIGERQGFCQTADGKIRFTPQHLLYDELKPFLPARLLSRQYPCSADRRDGEDITPILAPLFAGRRELQLLLLYRTASWFQFLFAKRALPASNVLIVKPSATIPSQLLAALLKNTQYDSLSVSPIGPNIKDLQFDLSAVSDGMVVVMDSFRADQVKKAEKGYDLLIQDVSGAAGCCNNVHHVIALISGYADLYLPREKSCMLSMDGVSLDSSPEAIKIAMKRLDANLVQRIEHGCNHGDLVKVFNSHITSIHGQIPVTIPKSKSTTYTMLLTALRLYNELFSPLFDADIEQYIMEWLSTQAQDRQALDDLICSEFGQNLNRKIADGSFRLVLKNEVTQHDKGSHTLVVDRNKRCVYVETADSFAIANEMKSIGDKDNLTTALYNCGYLPHNQRNEKSVRIAAITSDSTPYPLYVHAIGYTLLTPEIRQRFDLIDKEPYLFRHDELPKNFLPLIKTIDGRFAGKLLLHELEESNHYFGTGRTGSGKSWAVAQITCSLFMLGHRVIVFDVSRTYTKNKLLRMLPEDVVENLFRFISIGTGQDPLPIDLGSLKDCNGLASKKRAIRKVLEAALGKTDKDRAKDTKRKEAIKSFLSAYLKDKTDKVDMLSMIEAMRADSSIGTAIVDQLYTDFEEIAEIGYADAGWSDLFADTNKILVLDLGIEIGDSSHKLLDILVGSLCNWQTAHDDRFLDIIIDELADQSFHKESPLQTIVSQGRKFHTALFGATQKYYNQDNPSLNTMHQANIQSFCRPGSSEDRIAQKLGYTNAIDAGFSHFKAGDTIMQFDAFSKETGENEPITIRGKVVNFIETALYEKYKAEYLTDHTNPEVFKKGE